jgi:murein DD-endopeptidase MepM/ murein hydrolase activator NlpD
MALFTATLVTIAFALLPASPALAGGSSGWSSQGGSSWAEEATDTVPAGQDLPDEPPSQASADDLPEPATPTESARTPPVVDPGPPVAAPALTPGIVFPVAGVATYTNSFGAPRSGGRTHEGIDIFADKMTPVVAVAGGTVTLVRAGVGTDCCVVRIRHDDGRSSLYLHLNNDTPGTDDGLGYGIAEGIAEGTPVTAGMVIGFVGDSGNAEETPPHLHFELDSVSGVLLNPFAYLQVAQGADPALFASALAGQPEVLPETGLAVSTLLSASLTSLLIGVVLVSHRRRDILT